MVGDPASSGEGLTLPYRQGRYVLCEVLGQGGMAVVYRGKAIGAEGVLSDVAIKRIRPEWSQNPDFVTLLIDEARLLSQLQHPNIVQCHELGLDQGTYFLAMEFVAGCDLRTLLTLLHQDQVRLPDRFALFLVMEVLQGLAFAHAQLDPHGQPLRLVHRDISPQNILLSWQGEAKIADFGIAKGAHRRLETIGPQLKGKYAYMAPEQARGERIDRRADIFATGALLYELLTQERLFDGPNDLAVLERVREVRLPTGWEAKCHPVVRSCLRRALAPALTDRYPTAASFFADLSDFVTTHRYTANRMELATFLRELFPERVAQQQQRLAASLPPALVQLDDARPRTRGYTHAGAIGARRGRPRALTFGVIGGLGVLLGLRGDLRSAPRTLVSAAVPVTAATVSSVTRTVAVIPEPPLWPRLMPAWPQQSAPVVSMIDLPSVAVAVPASATPPPPPVAARRNQPPTPIDRPVSGVGHLAVSVRPWGYVTIPGLVTQREAPLQLAAKSGAYTVRVTPPDGGPTLSTRAVVHPDRRTTCQARLVPPARIWCR